MLIKVTIINIIRLNKIWLFVIYFVIYLYIILFKYLHSSNKIINIEIFIKVTTIKVVGYPFYIYFFINKNISLRLNIYIFKIKYLKTQIVWKIIELAGIIT